MDPDVDQDLAADLERARGKIARIVAAFDRAFVERQVHARMTLLATLAGHHVLLLGPPGTAKSLLARAIAQTLSGATYFEYLLSKFTHPDELFGPVSIPGLKEEDYRRLTEGFLPQAHVAFLDEIFKANSAILNSLLTLINERVFHHGRHRDPVPLVSLVGASNEAPDPEGGLGALYDRFLVRVSVPPVAEDDAFLQVALGVVEPFRLGEDDLLTMRELAAVRAAAASVTTPPVVRQLLLVIRRRLGEAGVQASDRRWRWAVDLLKVSAVTCGRSEVAGPDVVLLEHCFGDPGETDTTVRQIVRKTLERLAELGPEAQELHDAWAALSTAEDAAALADARAARLERLNAFRDRLQRTAAELDGRRDGLLEQSKDSPWLADVPTRLFAGFVAARQGLSELFEAEARYRQHLEGFSLYDEVVPRARQAQLASIGHRGRLALPDREPPLWISRPSEPPDRWIPVSADGLLLVEQRTAIVGDLARAHHRRAYQESPGPPDRPDAWHKHVRRVVLSDEVLFGLLQRGSPRDSIAELTGEDDAASDALRALVEWLRGTGFRDLPAPPEVR